MRLGLRTSTWTLIIGMSQKSLPVIVNNIFLYRNKLDVRVMYRFGQNEPRALVLPGCKEFCPLDEFIKLDN